MSITNYTELQQAVATWANRTDLPVQDLIRLAESRIWRHPGFQYDYHAGAIDPAFPPPDALVVAPGQVKVPLEETQPPFDKIITAVHEAWIEGYEDGRLQKVPHHSIASLNAQDGGKRGRPRYYAVSQFPGYVAGGAYVGVDYLWMYLAPIPDQYYTISVYGSINVTLSDTKPTNWLLTKHPDIYLYGALAEAEPYLKNDERIEVWNGRFEKGMDELKRHHDRVAWSGVHTMPRRVAMGEM